jgi:chemotaxis protein methyltransferase CheR
LLDTTSGAAKGWLRENENGFATDRTGSVGLFADAAGELSTDIRDFRRPPDSGCSGDSTSQRESSRMMNPTSNSQPQTPDGNLSARDFERVRKMIHARAGIALNETKRNMVYSRLSRRLRERDLPSFSAYLDLLESDDGGEWQDFVNALTTNLTSFFREAHHFEMLAGQLRSIPPGRPVMLWSAASSTGEEPYSMAITAAGSPACGVRILATDIDTQVLESGRRGVYRDEHVEKLDPKIVHRWFQRGTGSNAGKVRVRSQLREIVSFRQLNLLSPVWPVREKFAAVFCRNVMIYFDKPTQRAVLERIAARLEPEGMLYIGHSENLMWARDLFEPCGRTAYRVARAGEGR